MRAFTMMRRILILLLSSSVFTAEALSLRAVPSTELSACATVDCATGLICALAIPQSCNVAPCPKMPVCIPPNQTCAANSCKAEETCVLRSVTCVMAPCYPVRSCEKYPKCAANEEYNECSLSGPCEPNCKDSFPICSNVTCGSGACECKPGYYRENGKCMTKEQCPTPTCEKLNEVWSTCPSACPQTCRIFRGKEEGMACPAVCGSPQCTCAVGYVRDDDWNCVKEADCPKEFKCDDSHEEYKECSSHCEPTCDNRWPTCIESCGPAKCQCKSDYVRLEGHCLFGLQCPMAGNASIPSHLHDESVESAETSEEQDGPSCDTVRCAANTTCSIKKGRAICAKCGRNERLEACPNACSETSCGEPEGRMCAGVKMCMQPRCVCDEGFVRNIKNGRCVQKSRCPAGANNTMQILPIGIARPAPRPFFPSVNRTDDGMMHILPHWGDGTVNILPYVPSQNETDTSVIGPIPLIPRNGSFHILPIAENGTMSILPFFPGVNGTIQISPPKLVRPRPENGTMHTLPFIPSNRTMLVRPFFPSNESDATMHIMPHFDDETMHIMPHIMPAPGNESVHVMPVNENGTMHTLPFFPGNGTIQISPPRPQPRPLIRPRENETMHIMPHIDTGAIHILPYIPTELVDPIPGFNGNGSFHAVPVSENGTMSIMPFFGNASVHTRPAPLVRPRENETMHTLPFFPNNRTKPLVMPFENGTMSILPHVRPAFPGNGTFHTMPISENGTMSILPFFGNASAHTRPATRPLVRPRDNGTMHIMPIAENGTMHILPYPTEGSVHIMPVDSNASSVCANHTCPEGAWCEETTVQCFTAPCPPVPTCVSVKPAGGRDQPSCGRNEEFSTCAPRCQETCRGTTDCVEALMCTPGCACKPHFKRDGRGNCVPGNKCWKSNSCHENEVWHQCRACEPTCTDAKETCSAVCSTGCACDDGFVRAPSGDCVEQKACPKTTASTTKIPATGGTQKPSSSTTGSASSRLSTRASGSTTSKHPSTPSTARP